MKLDPRSLPAGYRILSENPRVVRLTAGRMSELNFATSVIRVVRVDVTGDAFLRDTTSLSPVWEESVITLIETLETEPSVLRITYREADGDRVLASRRLKTLQTMLTQHWREKPNRYRLQIETSLLLGSP